VIGGRGSFGEPEVPESFDELLAQLQGTIPNDALTARLRVENQGPSGPVTRQTSARQLLDQVVVGEKSFTVQVIAPRRARPAVVDGNVWKLRSTLNGGPATTTFTYGLPTDRKLMGDWDGNGTLTPAVYRNGTWFFRPSGNLRPRGLHLRPAVRHPGGRRLGR
jgi:hypothetical protein